ncbi:MAG: peptidylprolyl isomerase [Verrucomicrobiota bacterium]
MRFDRCLLSLVLLGATLVSRAEDHLPVGPSPGLADGLYAEFTTPRGVFTAELHYREAPLTVASFVGLAEGTLAPRAGRPFYSGLRWYRVVPGFVIQSGDPDHDLNKDKEDAGHPHTFPDEFVPGLRHGEAGILSMANAGPDTNSCEFFLTLADCTRLNYLHSVFGRVVRGLDVLPHIRADDAFGIRILRVGAAAQTFKADEAAFKALAGGAKRYAAAAEPGPDAHFDDPDAILPTEPPRAKHFNFKLANYERVTGLKVVARLSAKAPPAAEDELPGAYMQALAAQLGVAKTGVLAAFFAPDDWRVWIGDDVVAPFLGRPVAPGDLGEGGALHEAKTALLDAAMQAGAAAFAAQQTAAQTAGRPAPPPGQRIKLQTDALLDALLLRLEPQP